MPFFALRATQGQAGLTSPATVNETPAVVHVQYVEEAEGA